MGVIQFTKNHEDLSTDRGYQFKFICDRCGNGYMSEFQTSYTGVASDVLRAAGQLFGGVLGRVGSSTYDIQRAVGSKAHDEAFRKAVEEVRPRFRQCTRCGSWVCPDVCWNESKGLCEECAPDAQEEVAAAQAQATKDQIHEKARKTNYVDKIDVKTGAVVICKACGAKTEGGKFCPECGAPLAMKVTCAKCGAEANARAKFCPECGDRLTM
ncbi:MAG: zinc ribbon domain-containing protein [Acidobacteriota bacterium]